MTALMQAAFFQEVTAAFSEASCSDGGNCTGRVSPVTRQAPGTALMLAPSWRRSMIPGVLAFRGGHELSLELVTLGSDSLRDDAESGPRCAQITRVHKGYVSLGAGASA